MIVTKRAAGDRRVKEVRLQEVTPAHKPETRSSQPSREQNKQSTTGAKIPRQEEYCIFKKRSPCIQQEDRGARTGSSLRRRAGCRKELCG